MKDIHSHLLFGIDDGAKTIEESIKILKDMTKRGVTDIVLTPHYIINSRFSCSPVKKRELLKQLEEEVLKNDINVNLYLGNEIYIDDNIINLVKNHEVDTINNSKYLLIEFSLFVFPKNAISIISELMENGYSIILAHPERYSYLQENISFFNELKEMGVLFQCNYSSLFNKYGSYAKRNIKYLLKNNYVELLAGDIHHKVYLDLNKLKRKVKRYVKLDKIVEDLLINNFDRIVNDEDIIYN